MHFYISNLKAEVLDEAQASHLFVMRVQENKIYKASDLNGKVCKILITKVDKKTKTIEFEQASIPKQMDFIPKVMFQAIPDKVYLDKLCEVLPLTGITDLYFFYSQNSIEYPLNQGRITKILIRSCEQAEVAYLPKIVLLNKQDLEIELKKHLPIVLDCNVGKNLSINQSENVTDQSKNVKATTVSPQKIGSLVKETPTFPPSSKTYNLDQEQINKPALLGPEGGWSESEILYFQSLNLSFASLGSIIYPAWIAGLVWEGLTKIDRKHGDVYN